MPQLDKSTFFNQIFYLIVFFFLLYLFMLKYGLPTVVSAFKVRHYLFNQLKNQQVLDVSSIFNDRFLLLINKTSNITINFITSLRVELSNSYKQLSFFLLNHPDLITVYDKYVKTDKILNRFRFDKSSNARRFKEKQKAEKSQYNRS